MKIAANSAGRFVASPPPEIRAVLVYGPDNGLVRERCRDLVTAVAGDSDNPFNTQEILPSAVTKGDVHLIDEVLAVTFGGGRRALVVRDAGDDVAPAVVDVLENEAAAAPGAALIIVAAGNLPPRSKLRRLFENEEACAALPCYPDDEAGLAQLIRGMLGEHNITIESRALDSATTLLSNDRQANRRELEKLILYAGPNGAVSEEMVVACLGNSAEASVDELVLSAADGDYKALLEQLDRVWADGAEPVSIIRSAQRHFQRLHFAAALTRQGANPDAAMKQLRPPVFWRSAARFRGQLASLSLSTIEQALSRLTDAERAVKTTGAPGALVCDRALLAVAQLARVRSGG